MKDNDSESVERRNRNAIGMRRGSLSMGPPKDDRGARGLGYSCDMLYSGGY